MDCLIIGKIFVILFKYLQTNNLSRGISARVATRIVSQENFLETNRETLFETQNNMMSNSGKKHSKTAVAIL